ISPAAPRLRDLPRGAVLGTSSLRRAALARRMRPDLMVTDLRGNVQTRLTRLQEGKVQATILAYAGLLRLGLADRVTSLLETDEWLPAVGQGVIALVARTEDRATRDLLDAVDHRASSIALAAERAFLAVLDG